MLKLASYSQKLTKSIHIKDILTLTLGTVMAQIIGIAITPVITRIYTPEQLGLYTLVLTVISIFSPVINGRYDMCIVTADSDREANNTTVACLFLEAVFVIFILLTILTLNFLGSSVTKQVGLLIFWVIPILIISGLTNVFSSYNNRHKQYKIISSVSVIRSSAQGLGQVMLGLAGMGELGLLLAQFIASCLGIRQQIKYAVSNFNELLTVKFTDVITVLKSNRNQLYFSTPATLLNTFSYSIIYYLVNELFGIREVGYYSLSFRLLGLPIALVSANVARVFFVKACEERRVKGNFYSTFLRTSILLAVFSIPAFIILMVFGKNLFGVVFGSRWERAGLFVAILSPMFAIRFIVSALSLSVVIVKKQKLELVLQFIFTVESVASFFVSRRFNLSIENFLELICVLYSFTYVLWFTKMLGISKENADFNKGKG